MHALTYCVQVQELDLRGNGIRETGLVALSAFLQDNTTLRRLCLEWNSAGLFERGLSALVEALEGNTSVATLDLRNNKIGPEGGAALASMLCRNEGLTALGSW